MNQNFDSGPLSEVSAEIADGRWTLTFSREFRHAPERVWAMLTEPDQLARWAPFLASRALVTTGPATLTMIDGDEAVDLSCEVLRADPPKVLEYTWGGDVLGWELTPTEAGTRLVLRHETDEREMLSKAAAGWHLCLVVADAALQCNPLEPIRGERAMEFGWQALHDAYTARLGD
jgi:uncharacterized protein YndB with AHSA1/START domain